MQAKQEERLAAEQRASALAADAERAQHAGDAAASAVAAAAAAEWSARAAEAAAMSDMARSQALGAGETPPAGRASSPGPHPGTPRPAVDPQEVQREGCKLRAAMGELLMSLKLPSPRLPSLQVNPSATCGLDSSAPSLPMRSTERPPGSR